MRRGRSNRAVLGWVRMLATALATQGLGALYRPVGHRAAFLLTMMTLIGVYGVLTGLAALVEAVSIGRRRAAEDDRVEAWVVNELLGGKVTNPDVARRHGLPVYDGQDQATNAQIAGGVFKIIGGRTTGSPNDHGPDDTQSGEQTSAQ